jgi:hypothetical protein
MQFTLNKDGKEVTLTCDPARSTITWKVEEVEVAPVNGVRRFEPTGRVNLTLEMIGVSAEDAKRLL